MSTWIRGQSTSVIACYQQLTSGLPVPRPESLASVHGMELPVFAKIGEQCATWKRRIRVFISAP